MGAPQSTVNPVWKQFLRLGEELLEANSVETQCRLIEVTLQRMLACQARVFLAEPYYPLPGDAEMPQLPNGDSPLLAKEVLIARQMLGVSDRASTQWDAAFDAPCVIAVPILTREDLLGVIYVERLNGQVFTAGEWDFLIALGAHVAVSMQVYRQVTIKNWRSDQLALVRKVSAQIANVLDLDELCQQITQLILQTFNFYYVAVFTLENHGEGRLLLRASESQNPLFKNNPITSAQLGEGMIGHVAVSGQEMLARDVSQEPSYCYYEGLPGTRSEVSLPIKVENHILGVLDVQSDQLDAFHELDMQVLRALADNIALAVESARLYSDLKWRAEQISAVYEVSHALNSILDPDRLLEEVVQVIQKRFGYPYVHLYTVHSGRRKVIYRAGSGARSQALQEKSLSLDLDAPMGMISWTARNNCTFLANDVAREPLYLPSELLPDNTRAELDVPISFGDEVLGVLDIQADIVNGFDEADISLFEALSAAIAVAVRNANLYRTEQWRHQVADSFQDVAALISQNADLDQLMDTILTKLEGNLPCDASAIWLLDDSIPTADLDHPQLHLAASHGVPAEIVTSTLNSSSELVNWLEDAMHLHVPTIRQMADPLGPLGASLGFPQDYSSIGAPLRVGDQVLGLLTLAHHSPGRYGHESRNMTMTFASYAAVAIQNTRLYEDAQAQAWVSTILLQVSEATQASSTSDDLLATMVRLTPLLIGIKQCAFFLWEEDSGGFLLKNQYGLNLNEKEAWFDADTTPAFLQLRTTLQSVLLTEPSAELGLPEETIQREDGSVILIPLLAHGNLLGAFLVTHTPYRLINAEQAFEEQTLAILQGIAHQTAVALENLRLTETRQEEAYVTAVLLQVAQAVVSQNELNDIIETIVHLMPILVGIDNCSIYLWNRQENIFIPVQIYAGSHALEAELLKRSFNPHEFELLDLVQQQDAVYLVELPQANLGLDDWLNLSSVPVEQVKGGKVAAGSSWLMGFPLSVKGDVFGVMLARETAIAPGFWERRLEIINGVAQQVALAIQNERLKLATVDRERVEREIQLAHEIQLNFLPNHLPRVPGWEIDSRWQPAREVGGDFYDVFKLSGNRLGLVIADVSDKGMPAALYMTVTRTLIRANIQGMRSPSGVLERVNRLLTMDSQSGMFITAAFAVLDRDTGQVIYANAGHNRPLWIKRSGGMVEALPKGGLALGVLAQIKLEDYTLTLEPGDSLLLYTDGVTESFSPEGETFGEKRLCTLLNTMRDKSIQEILTVLDATLIEYRAGAAPSDDVTIVAVRREPLVEV